MATIIDGPPPAGAKLEGPVPLDRLTKKAAIEELRVKRIALQQFSIRIEELEKTNEHVFSVNDELLRTLKVMNKALEDAQ